MARPKIEDERREQILSAFEACVMRQGLAKTSLADVAAEAELPRSLVRYFVGNRDDMVELLVSRMIARAENELTRTAEQGPRPRTIYQVVDFLFDSVFTDPTSNGVVGELWYLALRDERIRAQLREVYTRLFRKLVAGLGTMASHAPKKDVEAVAFTLLSLAYGEACFYDDLKMKGPPRKRMRKLAHDLVETLENDMRITRRERLPTMQAGKGNPR